jgi:hypothetical protein
MSPLKTRSYATVHPERCPYQILDGLREIRRVYEFLCMWLSPHEASKKDASMSKARNRNNRRLNRAGEIAKLSKEMDDLPEATERLRFIQGEIANLQLRIGHARMSITRNSMALGSTHETILLRVFYDKSFCRYDPSLGILSSNFAACKPVKCIDELKTRAELTETTLRNHCGGSGATSFISLTNNVGSLSRYTKGNWRYRESDPRSSAMVALVSKEKLDYIEIICATLRSLVEDVSVTYWSLTNQDGACYASNEHFMVYSWIPLQCIEEVISLARFERICSHISEAATGDDVPAEG